MVFSRELPHSFSEALRVCKEIISANHQLIRRNTLDTEAELLVLGAYRAAGAGKLTRAQFFSRLQDSYPEAAGEKLLVLAGMRAQGFPLQHALGYQVFLDHEYEVNSSTLIPRPETEVLVTEAIQAMETPILGIEIGLGTGIISIELLHRFPGLKMRASELSLPAQGLARKNAVRILGDDSRIEILTPKDSSDVLGPFVGSRADFIISNPPYLDARSSEEFDEDVLQHEPRAALFPEGGDPLHFYKQIASGGAGLLSPGGRVFLEVAHERAEATKALFQAPWKCRLINDLAGRPRVLIAEI